nr:spore germination protein [Alicyclobacillus fastidiosus]
MFGLYGVMVGLILIANHLNSLESFGVPYLSPVVPAEKLGLRDTIVRMPIWSMKRRPKQLHTNNPIRVRAGEDANDRKGRPLSQTTGVLRVKRMGRGKKIRH